MNARLALLCGVLMLLVAVFVLVLRRPSESTVEDPGAERIDGDDGEVAATAGSPSLRGHPAPEPAESVGDPVIRGQVVDAKTGQPVAGVPVLVLRTEGAFETGPPSPVLLALQSGDDGGFDVERVPGGRSEVCLLAMGNGWVAEAAAEAPPHRPRDPAWFVRLRDGEACAVRLLVVPAARVEGRVLFADGQPAVGATVGAPRFTDGSAGSPRGWNVHARLERVVADAEGRFLLDNLSPGREVYLDARLDGHSRVLSEALDLTPGETTPVTFRFTSPRRATVQVASSEDSRPIAGALVRIYQYGAAPRGIERVRTSALTGADGVVSLTALPPEEFHLRIERSGFLPFRSRGKNARTRLFTEESAGRYRTRVTLEPVAWVSGRVVLPEGVRREDVEIWVEVGALDAPGYESYGFGIATSIAREAGEAGFDPDGAFRIPVPRTGLYTLSAVAHGYIEHREIRATVEVRPGQTGVEIMLDVRRREWPGVPVDWWVLDVRLPDGSQAVHATFEVEDEGLDDEIGSFYENLAGREQARGVDGSWNIPVRPESPGLWIEIQGKAIDGTATGRRMYGPFAAGGGRRTIQLPPTGVIRGRALLPDGTPLIGAEIQAWAARANSSHRALCAIATTDAEGSFLLVELGEDDYQLRMKGDGPWLPPRRVVVPPGTEDVLLQTLDAVSATVTVLLPSGEPAPRASVTARPRSAGRAQLLFDWGTTDADGRVVLARLEHGATYDLSAGHGTVRGAIEGWTPSETTLRLGRDARWQTVSGHVVDQRGAPVAGAHVALEDASGERHLARTRESGAFSMGRVPEGRARLVAAWTSAGLLKANASPSREIASGTTDVELVLSSLRDLDVQVTGLSSRRVDHLTLSLVPLDPDGEEDDRLTSKVEDGAARFRGLDPQRRYLLWGRLGVLDWHVYAKVRAGAASITAALRRGGAIRGRVHAATRARRHLKVILRGPAFWNWGELDPEGRFVIHAVPEGEWTVEASRYVEGVWRSASVQARAGDEVEIDLRSP